MKKFIPILLTLLTFGLTAASCDEWTFTNVSTCRRDMGATEMQIQIPSIKYDCPVYHAGIYSYFQAAIDTGALVNLTDPNTQLSQIPGVGTVYIAGHHYSHGAPWYHILDIPIGGRIRVITPQATACFVVTEIRNVRSDDSLAIYHYGDPYRPSITLQASDSGIYRWMVYGDLTTC